MFLSKLRIDAWRAKAKNKFREKKIILFLFSAQVHPCVQITFHLTNDSNGFGRQWTASESDCHTIILFELVLFELVLFELVLFELVLFEIVLFELVLFKLVLFELVLFEQVLFELVLLEVVLFKLILFDQIDQMSLWKSRTKCSPNIILPQLTGTVQKVAKKIAPFL
jgi:hypothetical protein